MSAGMGVSRAAVIAACIAGLAAGCGTPAGGARGAGCLLVKGLPIPEDLREDVARAERVGREIFFQDQAAATGTDVLFARVERPDDHGVGGFLTVPEGGEGGAGPPPSFQVMFFTRDEEPRIAFRVHVPAREGVKPSLERIDPPAPPSGEERVLIRGRQAALAALEERIQPINPVVLPGSLIGEDGILVYLLASTQENRAVFDKHYRVLVSADGRTVKRFEPLSKTAMELPMEPPEKGERVGLFVSHLLSDSPIETHVFTSMLHRLPVVVDTARGKWLVEGDRVKFLGDRPPAGE